MSLNTNAFTNNPAIPPNKQDARPLTTPASQTWRAVDGNTILGMIGDLRAGLQASSTVEYFVTPQGSDANDGLHYGTAKATVYGAYAAVLGLGGGKRGRIYIVDGSAWHPNGTDGLYLTSDSAVYTGSAVWQRAVSCRFTGIGSQGAVGSKGGQADVLPDIGPVSLRLYGAQGMIFENLIFEGRTELDVNPATGLPAGDTNHLTAGIWFDNCSFYSEPVAGQPYPALLSGYAFWINFVRCGFEANYGLGVSKQQTVVGNIDGTYTSGTSAKLLYPQDVLNFQVGVNVLVGATLRSISAIDTVNGILTFDSATGLAAGAVLSRNNVATGDTLTNVSTGMGGSVTLTTHANAANYCAGDMVFAYPGGSYQTVQSVNASTGVIVLDNVPGSWNTGQALYFTNVSQLGQPMRAGCFMTPDVPGSNSSPGLFFFEHVISQSCGLFYYPGNTTFNLDVHNWVMEGVGASVYLGPAITIVPGSNFGRCKCDSVSIADAVSVPSVSVIGLRSFTPRSDVVKVFNADAVLGPATADSIGPSSINTTPVLQGQVGFFNGKVYGVHDAARRENAPASALGTNLASSNPSDFASATATITTGKADPAGGTKAFRLTQNGSGNTGAIIYSTTGAFSAGEIIIAGVWCRNPSQVTGAGNVLQATGGAGFSLTRQSSGDGDWQWCAGSCLAVVEGSDTLTMSLACFDQAAAYQDFYGPVLYRLPAATYSATDIAEIVQNLGCVPSNAPAGTVAPMQSVAIAERLRAFQKTTQAGDKPTIAAGANVGAGPTLTLGAGSTDLAGTLSITTGTGSAAGAEAVVSFAANAGNFAAAPAVALTPTNANAAAIKAWVSSAVGAFTVEFQGTPADGTVYTFVYHAIGIG